MRKKIQVPKFLLLIACVWLYCVLFAYQNGGIVAGIYLFAVGASPAILAVWLATHPKTEG